MKISLVVLSAGKAAGKALSITAAQFIIGRDPECNLRPASAMISKRHCAVLVKDGQVSLRDFDSTNGTFINEEPVKGEVPLKNGDIIKVGPLSFKVVIEAGTLTPKPPNKTTPPPPAADISDDDAAAAALLAFEDDGTVGSSGAGEEVPGGSTVMDMPPRTSKEGEPAAGKPEQRNRPRARSTPPARSRRRQGHPRQTPHRQTQDDVMPSPSDYPTLRRLLLHWFRKQARPLPWRATRDPYAIWISEVMLQQTQVATVIAYFERFIRQFPDLQSLADADEQTVLRLWEGLGYYRRARDLCRAARLLVELDHATIPDDPDLVRSLPGFGRYTTNAVLSQAFDRRLPILEANPACPVACRHRCEPKRNRRAKAALATRRLARGKAGDFNQALMELSAPFVLPRRRATRVLSQRFERAGKIGKMSCRAARRRRRLSRLQRWPSSFESAIMYCLSSAPTAAGGSVCGSFRITKLAVSNRLPLPSHACSRILA